MEQQEFTPGTGTAQAGGASARGSGAFTSVEVGRHIGVEGNVFDLW